nr:OmpA family protein [Thermoactinospora rubra]
MEESVRGLELPVQSLRSQVSQNGRTRVTISSDVLFAFGKAELTEAAKREIAALAPALRGTVRVEGHTDALGTPAYNLRLSRLRALRVKQELDRLTGGGVRIVAVGYGEARPIAPNTRDGKDYPAGRARNRRVVIVYQG